MSLGTKTLKYLKVTSLCISYKTWQRKKTGFRIFYCDIYVIMFPFNSVLLTLKSRFWFLEILFVSKSILLENMRMKVRIMYGISNYDI